MVNTKSKCFVLSAMAIGLVVSACTMREPDHFTPNRTRLQQATVEQSHMSTEMDESAVIAMAEHYRKHGDGPFKLVVTYDPQSKINTAMQATNKASSLAGALRKEGVVEIQPNILPVKDSGDVSKILVSYTGYDALAPDGCELMPGIDTREINANEDYQLGCTIDTLFARQVARPKDLLGQTNAPYGDARRISNQTGTYRSGAGLGELGGESATGN